MEEHRAGPPDAETVDAEGIETHISEYSEAAELGRQMPTGEELR